MNQKWQQCEDVNQCLHNFAVYENVFKMLKYMQNKRIYVEVWKET